MGNDRPWQWYERHLSAPRLAHYLTQAGGDPKQAVALYEWNTAVSAAFWRDLALFEVALRNTLDARMSLRHARLNRPGHWIFDDARELGRDKSGSGRHEQPYRDIAEAIRRVRSNRKRIDPGQVISEVSFGFWHQLVSRRQLALWPDLAGGFPSAPRRDQALVHEPVSRLRSLRNRIGHHHRVWALDLPNRHEDLLTVTEYIDPDLRGWIESTSHVATTLTERPD